jgi:hypothetical protein
MSSSHSSTTRKKPVRSRMASSWATGSDTACRKSAPPSVDSRVAA